MEAGARINLIRNLGGEEYYRPSVETACALVPGKGGPWDGRGGREKGGERPPPQKKCEGVFGRPPEAAEGGGGVARGGGGVGGCGGGGGGMCGVGGAGGGET